MGRGSRKDGGQGGECEVKGESGFRGLASIARASVIRHGRLIVLPLRTCWPFSVAPRPLGPAFLPRGSLKCSS